MIDLEAIITEVTVYADRALITRRGSVELEVGEHELRVNNLPQFQRDSLRAAGQGPQGTRILNVDVITAYYSRPPEGEIQALQDELDALVQNKLLLEARSAALKDRRQWLRALGEQSKDFARGLSQGQMNPQDCADFFRFAAAQALEDAEAALSLDSQLKQVQQDIHAKQRELARRQGHRLPDRLAAVVTLSTEEAGSVELELSYLVMGASWYPQYDVRVQMNDERDNGEVELTYVGVVQQSTGKSWEHVGLSLSTARPSLAAVLPELDPWYLNVYTPPIIRPMSVPQPMAAMARRVPLNAAMSTPASFNGDEDRGRYDCSYSIIAGCRRDCHRNGRTDGYRAYFSRRAFCGHSLGQFAAQNHDCTRQSPLFIRLCKRTGIRGTGACTGNHCQHYGARAAQR